MARGALQAAHASASRRAWRAMSRCASWHARQRDGLVGRAAAPRRVRQNEGPGNALMAVVAYEHVTEVFTAFGEKTLSAEQVAHRLVKEVRAFQKSEAPSGPHLADQLALLLALAVWQRGEAAAFSCSEVTRHTRTNCAVIERFLPVRFAIAQGAEAATVQVTPA